MAKGDAKAAQSPPLGYMIKTSGIWCLDESYAAAASQAKSITTTDDRALFLRVFFLLFATKCCTHGDVGRQTRTYGLIDCTMLSNYKKG